MSLFGNPGNPPPPWQTNAQPMTGQKQQVSPSLPVFGSVAGTNAPGITSSNNSRSGGGILGKPGLLPSSSSMPAMSFTPQHNTGILSTNNNSTTPPPPLFARSGTSSAPPVLPQPMGNTTPSVSQRPAFAFTAGQSNIVNASAPRFGTQPPFSTPSAGASAIPTAKPATQPLSFTAPSFVPSTSTAPATLSVTQKSSIGFGSSAAAAAPLEGASVFGALAPSSSAPTSSAFGTTKTTVVTTSNVQPPAGQRDAVHSAFAAAAPAPAPSGVFGATAPVTWPSTTPFATTPASAGRSEASRGQQQESNNQAASTTITTQAEQSSFAAQLQRRESRFASSFAAATKEGQGGLGIPAPRSAQQQQQQYQSTTLKESSSSAIHSPAPFSPITESTSTAMPGSAPWQESSNGGGSNSELCPLARVFAIFLRHLAVPASRAQASAEVELALEGLAGRLGLYVDFRRTTNELLRVWQESRRLGNGVEGLHKVRGEMWVLSFGLGAQINLIVHAATHGAQGLTSHQPSRPETQQLMTYMNGVQAHRDDALADACGYANRLSQLALELYQHEEDTLAPYTVLPLLLRRVRTTFEAASAHGVVRVASNLKAITAKLFSLLNKRVKATVVQFTDDPQSSSSWTLTCRNATERQLVFAFAHLVSEMSMAEAPSNEEMEHFMVAFHRAFPQALPERCKLYFCKANLLLGQALTLRQLRLAAELFARALLTCPDESPHGNRRLFFLKLTATQLALGALPNGDDLVRYATPQLADVVVAVRAASLPLFDLAMRHNAVFYVQTGIHNVLQMVRQRIALLMVVKFYLACGCQSRLSVTRLIAHYALPYSEMEAMTIWLLPLLVEKYINGVLDGFSLVLSDANPFDEYDKATLLRVAAEEYPTEAP